MKDVTIQEVLESFFELIEETPDGPMTIGYILGAGWALKLMVLLNMELREDGRRFAYIQYDEATWQQRKGGTAG